MPKGSGGGGRPGRGGGGGGGGAGDSPLTANMRKYYEPGGATVQQTEDGTVQATHEKATIRIYPSGNAEVWSSKAGGKAFKPTSGSLRSYSDPMKALGEFEKRTGIFT